MNSSAPIFRSRHRLIVVASLTLVGVGIVGEPGQANTSASEAPNGQTGEFATAAAADGPTDPSSTEDRGQAPPKSAATVDAANPDVASDVVDDALIEAVAEGLNISVDQAAERIARQPEQIERGRSLEENLNGRSGGFYIGDDGHLVVTTVDAAGDVAVKKAGVQAKRVRNTSARLDAIAKNLARHADKLGDGEVRGWYVDVPSNSVVVEVTEGADDPATNALLAIAQRFGASVRIEFVDPALKPTSAADLVVGGDGYVTPTGGSCSVGFNAMTRTGYPVVITAGHCVDGKTNHWTKKSGYWFGRVRSESYPYNDYGTIWNEYSYYFRPTAWVGTWNGGAWKVRGYWDSPTIGAYVCKSGITTQWTCGLIRSHNAYQNWGHGYVYGLVRHSACVQPGDSGGANIHPDGWALGVSSGAWMYDLDGDGRVETCRNRYRSWEENVSFYQPVGQVLRNEGLTLLTTN